MNSLALTIAPIVLFLTGGALFMEGNAEAPEHLLPIAAPSAPTVPDATNDVAPVEDESTDSPVPLVSTRFRDRRIPGRQFPVKEIPSEPIAHIEGRFRDLRHRPLTVAGLRIFPASGDVNQWLGKIEELEDSPATIDQDAFRIPLCAEGLFHVAVRTQGGRWFLIESVDAHSGNLLIELPVDPSATEVAPRIAVAPRTSMVPGTKLLLEQLNRVNGWAEVNDRPIRNVSILIPQIEVQTSTNSPSVKKDDPGNPWGAACISNEKPTAITCEPKLGNEVQQRWNGSNFVLAEKGSFKGWTNAATPAAKPTCLPTRAWDEETGAEFYCWDLTPAA